MPSVIPLECPAATRPFAVVGLALLIAACGPAPQGGFQGFPPARGHDPRAAAKDASRQLRVCRADGGVEEVEVRARVTGILEKRLFAEGAPVKAGQPLFVIDPKPLEAQAAAAAAEVARARAQLTQAEREVTRLKPLAERRAIGQKEADDAISNAELAGATMKAAEARLAEVNLSLGYTRVNAPITGLSSRANKSEGSLVNANETLLTMISAQIDPIWVPFNVSENDRLGLERAVAAGRLVLPKGNAYDVTVRLSDGSAFPRQGRINFSDTRVNPATGTYEMRAEIANADGALKPGQFVRVVLKGATRTNAIAVPQYVAVQDGPQGKFVYVTGKDKDGKDIAAVRPITLGDWVEVDGTYLWLVESGLEGRRHGDRRRHRQAATGRRDRAGRTSARCARRRPGSGQGCAAGQRWRQGAVAQILSAGREYVFPLLHRPPDLCVGHLGVFRDRGTTAYLRCRSPSSPRSCRRSSP